MMVNLKDIERWFIKTNDDGLKMNGPMERNQAMAEHANLQSNWLGVVALAALSIACDVRAIREKLEKGV